MRVLEMEKKNVQLGECDLEVLFEMKDESFGYDYGSISGTHTEQVLDTDSLTIFLGVDEITQRLNDRAIEQIVSQLT